VSIKKKVGIIRCQQTEDLCAGIVDFNVAQRGILAFQETGSVDIIGFVSCGGCPGKRVIQRVQLMLAEKADIIVFASCITKGNPFGFPCPHYKFIKKAIRKKLGNDFQIIEWTH